MTDAHSEKSAPPPMNEREPTLVDEKAGDVDLEGSKASNETPEGEKREYLTGKRLVAAAVSMLVCIFLVALDQTIVATALPTIGSVFNAYSYQGWVSSAFILTQSAFILVFGQILRLFIAKYTLLVSIIIFELGSILCGAATSIYMLIVGRAIAGLGAAGLFLSMIQVLTVGTHIRDRPKVMGALGGIFGISSIIGPLIGGALTQHVSWRWCFYINAPIGGASFVVVFFLLPAQPPPGSDPSQRTLRGILHQAKSLDYVGMLLAIAAVTCLNIALQWGGNLRPWDDAGVIATFVVSGVTAIALILWERFVMGEKAMIPPSIYKSISIYAINVFSFIGRLTMMIFIYYLPVFYQAVHGRDPTQSGIDILALMLSTVITVIAAGQISAKIGRYWHWMVIGPFFIAIGAGLLYTVSREISSAKLIGYQILLGVGIGMTLQNSVLAIQAEFNDQPKMLAQATGIASFFQFLGGSIGLAIAQPVFAAQLKSYLATYAPDAPAYVIDSPNSIWTELPVELRESVTTAYAYALRDVFIIGVPCAGIMLISAFFINNLKFEKKPH